VRLEAATYGNRVDGELARRLEVGFENSLRAYLNRHGVVDVVAASHADNVDFVLEVRIVDAVEIWRSEVVEDGTTEHYHDLELRGVAILTSATDPHEIHVCPIPVPGTTFEPRTDTPTPALDQVSQERREVLFRASGDVVAQAIAHYLGLATAESIQAGVLFTEHDE
jgi:hypothetical protein